MRIVTEVKLDYKDVLIQPKRSTLKSRKEVDLRRKFKFRNSGNFWSGIPIMAAYGRSWHIQHGTRIVKIGFVYLHHKTKHTKGLVQPVWSNKPRSRCGKHRNKLRRI